jgi:Zn-dependent protease with chaperone function
VTGMGAPQGLGWAEMLTVRGFSRTQESNADEFALEVIHAEYGHVGSAFDFFRRDDESGGGSRAASWISTHPLSGDRVTHLEQLASERGWSLAGVTRPAIASNNND